MKGISGPLVQELRRIASQGASVPDLLRLLHERLGREAAYGTLLAKYFMVAFDLPLRSVSPIGGWAPDSTGEISDARIQELIHPEIMRKKPLWHGSDLADRQDLPGDAFLSPVEPRRVEVGQHPLVISGELQRRITAALLGVQAHQRPLIISEGRLEPWRDAAKDTEYNPTWEPAKAA